MIDLGDYECMGNPDRPEPSSKGTDRRQRECEAISAAVARELKENPAPPLSRESREKLVALLRDRTPEIDLVRWRVRLYCGHTVERTSHRSHKTVASALSSAIRCTVCGLDPASIVAARAVGPALEV